MNYKLNKSSLVKNIVIVVLSVLLVLSWFGGLKYKVSENYQNNDLYQKVVIIPNTDIIYRTDYFMRKDSFSDRPIEFTDKEGAKIWDIYRGDLDGYWRVRLIYYGVPSKLYRVGRYYYVDANDINYDFKVWFNKTFRKNKIEIMEFPIGTKPYDPGYCY